MDELRKNEIFPSEITGYTSEGMGVCRIGGRVVFVKNALRGEKADIRILKVNKSAVYGKIEILTEESSERREPSCPHYKYCGGCALMHMTYREELSMKLSRVNDALKRIGEINVYAERINPSPMEYAYRNKAIYSITEKDGSAVYGFYKEHTHDVSDASGCLINMPTCDTIARTVTDWMEKYGIRAYNEKTKHGAIRRVFIRTALCSWKTQVVLISAERNLKKLNELITMLLNAQKEISSIVLNINKTNGNTVLSGEFVTLWGEASLKDNLCGLDFSFGPQSFYQVNPYQTPHLYAKVLEYADIDDGDTVLDLYCGVGTITLCLAKKAGHVIGAEIVPDAIGNALDNAKINRITNVEFVCADSAKIARCVKNEKRRIDVITVDPPRKGLEESVIADIVEIAPRRVVYVSCNPSTLARDLKMFEGLGYFTEKCEVFDMFPKSAHVETVACIVKSNSNE